MSLKRVQQHSFSLSLQFSFECKDETFAGVSKDANLFGTLPSGAEDGFVFSILPGHEDSGTTS